MEPGLLGEMACSRARVGNIQDKPRTPSVQESKEVLKTTTKIKTKDKKIKTQKQKLKNIKHHHNNGGMSKRQRNQPRELSIAKTKTI